MGANGKDRQVQEDESITDALRSSEPVVGIGGI